MTGISRITQREQLARRIECMRPTDDAVHEAMLEATQFGLTYTAIAGATGSTELRAQRWSAGADIPGTVSKRRAILSTLQRLLSEMTGPPDRRVGKRKKRPSEEQDWMERKDKRVGAAILSLREAGKLLCAHCMRNRNNNDVVCTSRNCRNKVNA